VIELIELLSALPLENIERSGNSTSAFNGGAVFSVASGDHVRVGNGCGLLLCEMNIIDFPRHGVRDEFVDTAIFP
jgi:hypothetical protein